MQTARQVIYLFLFIATTLVVGATGHAEQSGPVDITIASLRGPTGVGMAPALLDQPIVGEHARISVEVVPEPSVMVGRLAAGEVAVGMLPSNVAAQLYNRGIPVQIAAVTLWGVLYVVGTDETVQEWTDLRGRSVQAIARGAGPDIMLRHILSRNGVDPDSEVELDYRYGHVELAQLLIAGEVETAVLPEPFVTQVLSRADGVDVRLDFQEAWQDLYDSRYPQTVIVVRRDIAEENPEAIAEALAVIRSGWDTVLADPDAAGGLVDRTDLGLPGAVVTAALPRFNAEYVGAADAADRLDEYFRVLFAAEPRAIGGALPDDDIYLR
ncbi:MAG: ABC transporter substrate-binding protein [Spirochaeta sp.]|jgi:NitT/TauT family transport system substrate-binding protein|nr:ABC transporter substrate-binding protein [Spirochaeta sp.]